MSLLKVHGTIRIRCSDRGTSKWKEGSFEIVEKEDKACLVVEYNAGGPPKTFKLSQNVKSVHFRPNIKSPSRLMITLKDSAHLTIDKVPASTGREMQQYLLDVSNGKTQTVKPSLGSGSFGVILGSRSTQKEENLQIVAVKSQAPTRSASTEIENSPVHKFLSTTTKLSAKTSPGNSTLGNKGTVSPTSSMGAVLQDNSYNHPSCDSARKFLSSCREKQLTLKKAEENKVTAHFALQTSSFYSSQPPTKDYSSFGSANIDRCNVSTQSPSVKRSLGFVSHPSAVKKMRQGQDYTGWNKSRFPLSSQMQQLQGFSNLGNACYMNAILQSLFSLQPFVNDLLKQRIPWKKMPSNTLIRRFAFLLSKKDFCSYEEKKELLKRVKGAISATAERFSGYMQNDAHEFLNQCLDQMKEDMEKLNKTWKNEHSSGDENAALHSSEDFSAPFYSCPVTCNFEFEVQHSISCKTCGEIITKRERFNDLSIDLPRRRKLSAPRSIQDSLDLFFRTEEINYCCEKCNEKSALVMHKFNKLPRILILHLKRYSFNVALFQSNKVGQQIIIPRYLALSSHCTDNTQSPLTLGWSSCNTVSQPLKNSQIVNSSFNTSTPARKYSFKSIVTRPICQESDSEDEQPRRRVANSLRLYDRPSREQQLEDLKKASRTTRIESEKQTDLQDVGFDGMSEDELLATVLEMSKRESSLSVGLDEEYKRTSSPDTGFGDDELQEMADNAYSIETEKPKVSSATGQIVSSEISKDSEIVKDFDENKENKTPEGSQADVDWLQQYDLEREEQEIRQAMAQSIQDQEAQAQKEVDDLKRAKELSLQEFNSSFLGNVCSDEDSGNEEVLDMEYTEYEAETLRRNAETGAQPHSYRLLSVVSHIGSTSSSGHYISDVFDVKKLDWFTYDDLMVSKIQESEVLSDRDRTGYIFFYIHREIFEDLLADEQNLQPSCVDPGRPVRPPL